MSAEQPPVNPLDSAPAPDPIPPAMEDPQQAQQDAGMYAGGLPTAIERRLIHVDRVAEETLVQVKQVNGQLIGIMVGITILAVMVYMVSKQVKGVPLD